jgi:hypothetical protein
MSNIGFSGYFWNSIYPPDGERLSDDESSVPVDVKMLKEQQFFYLFSATRF